MNTQFNLSGADLRQWREEARLSQQDVGNMLGVSHSAINRWENGQEIPGPAQILLRMVIFGEMPANLPLANLGQMRQATGGVEMSVSAFEQCVRLARAAGCTSVTEWIGKLVNEALQK